MQWMVSELLGRRDAVTWMKMAMSIKLDLPKLVSAGVVVIGHVPLYWMVFPHCARLSFACLPRAAGYNGRSTAAVKNGRMMQERVQKAKSHVASERWLLYHVPPRGGKAGRYAIGAATDSSFWRGAVIG